MTEQVADWYKRSGNWHDRLPLRHIGGDGCKQPGGGGDGCPRVDRNVLVVRGITRSITVSRVSKVVPRRA